MSDEQEPSKPDIEWLVERGLGVHPARLASKIAEQIEFAEHELAHVVIAELLAGETMVTAKMRTWASRLQGLRHQRWSLLAVKLYDEPKAIEP
jgi:hypothetical protein